MRSVHRFIPEIDRAFVTDVILANNDRPFDTLCFLLTTGRFPRTFQALHSRKVELHISYLDENLTNLWKYLGGVCTPRISKIKKNNFLRRRRVMNLISRIKFSI